MPESIRMDSELALPLELSRSFSDDAYRHRGTSRGAPGSDNHVPLVQRTNLVRFTTVDRVHGRANQGRKVGVEVGGEGRHGSSPNIARLCRSR